MTDIEGLPYYEVTFEADGGLSDDGGLAAAVAGGQISDLFVFSHGWNNSADSAHSLYRAIFRRLAGMLGPKRATSAAVGVFWPSLLFPEDDPDTPDTPSSGAQLATALRPAFPGHEDNLAVLGGLLDQRPQDSARLQQFHQLAAALVTTPAMAPEDAGPQAAISGETSAVFGHAAAMAKASANAQDAQGLPSVFGTMWSGAREVLRTLSYYEMKNRAGVVGQRGLGPLIARVAGGGQAGSPLAVHLIGHSFGARLVSFALTGLPGSAVGAASPVKSLTLIQGAFSHFSFAKPTPCAAVPAGALAGMRSRIDGPLLATFSAADRAVGWWYPAASMLAHQNAQALSDLTYEWGGMGHDGFQQSPACTLVKLQPKGFSYGFAKDGIYRLDANSVIKADQSEFSGAHSDIRHPEIAWAVRSAAG